MDSDTSESAESEDNTQNRQFDEKQLKEVLQTGLSQIEHILVDFYKNNTVERTDRVKKKEKSAIKKNIKDKGNIANKNDAFRFQNEIQQLCNKISDISSSVSQIKSKGPGNSRRDADAIPGTSRSVIGEVSSAVVPGNGNSKGETGVPGTSRTRVDTALTNAAKTRPAGILTNHRRASEASGIQAEVKAPAVSRRLTADNSNHSNEAVSGASRRHTEIETAVSNAARTRPAGILRNHLKASCISRIQTDVTAPEVSRTCSIADNSNHSKEAISGASKSHAEPSRHETIRKNTDSEELATSRSPRKVLAPPRSHIEAVGPESSKTLSKAISTFTGQIKAISPHTPRGDRKPEAHKVISQSAEVPTTATSSKSDTYVRAEKPRHDADVKRPEIPSQSETIPVRKTHVQVKEPETPKSQSKVSETSGSGTEAVRLTTVSKIHKEPVTSKSDVAGPSSETRKSHTKPVVSGMTASRAEPATSSHVATASPTASKTGKEPFQCARKEPFQGAEARKLEAHKNRTKTKPKKSNTEIVTSGHSKRPTEAGVFANSRQQTEALTSKTLYHHTKTVMSKNPSAGAITPAPPRHAKIGPGSSRNHKETHVLVTSKTPTAEVCEAPKSNTEITASEGQSPKGHTKTVVPGCSRSETGTESPRSAKALTEAASNEAEAPETSGQSVVPSAHTPTSNIVPEVPSPRDYTEKKAPKIPEIRIEFDISGLSGTSKHHTKTLVPEVPRIHSEANVSGVSCNSEPVTSRSNKPKATALVDNNRTDENTGGESTNTNLKRIHDASNDDTAKRARTDHKCRICYKSFHNDEIEEHYKNVHDLHHDIKHNRQYYEHKFQDLDNRCRRSSTDTIINKAKNNEVVKEKTPENSRGTTTEETIAPNEGFERTEPDRNISSMECEDDTIDLTSDTNDESKGTVFKAVQQAKPETVEGDQILNEQEVIDLDDDLFLYDLPEDKDRSENRKSDAADIEKNNNTEINNLEEEPEIADAEKLLAINVKKEQALNQGDDNNIVKSAFFNTEPNILQSSDQRKHDMIEKKRERRDSHTSRNDNSRARTESSNKQLNKINTDKTSALTSNNPPDVSNHPHIQKDHRKSIEKHKSATAMSTSQPGLSDWSTPVAITATLPLTPIFPSTSSETQPTSTAESLSRNLDFVNSSPTAQRTPNTNPGTGVSKNRGRDSASEPRKRKKKLTRTQNTAPLALGNPPESPSRKNRVSAQNSTKHTSNANSATVLERDARKSESSKHRKQENKTKKAETQNPTSTTVFPGMNISLTPNLGLPTSKERSSDTRPFKPIQLSVIQSSANSPSFKSHAISSSTAPAVSTKSVPSTMTSSEPQSKYIKQYEAAVSLALSAFNISSSKTSVSVSNSMPTIPTVSTSSRHTVETCPRQPTQLSVPRTTMASSTSHSTSSRVSTAMSQSCISKSTPIKSSNPSVPRLTKPVQSASYTGTNMPSSTSKSIVTTASIIASHSNISKPTTAPKSNLPSDPKLSKSVFVPHVNLPSSTSISIVPPPELTNSSKHAPKRDALPSVPQLTTSSLNPTSRFGSPRTPSTDPPTQSNVSTSSPRASLSNVRLDTESNPKYTQRPQTLWRHPPEILEGQRISRAPTLSTEIRASNSEASNPRPILTPRPPSQMMTNLRTASTNQPSWHIPEERPEIDTTQPTPSRDTDILEYLSQAGSRDPRLLKRFAAAYQHLKPFLNPKRQKK